MADVSQGDQQWFVLCSIIFIIGLVWAFAGESGSGLVFATLAFVLFLRAGITMEMNARAHSGH